MKGGAPVSYETAKLQPSDVAYDLDDDTIRIVQRTCQGDSPRAELLA